MKIGNNKRVISRFGSKSGHSRGVQSRGIIEAVEPRLLLSTVNSWKHGVSGDFDTASDWSLGHVPTSSEIASITASGTYTVTLDMANHVLAGLVVGGSSGTQTLVATSHTVTLDGASTVSSHGAVTINGCTLNGTATLTNGGTAIIVDDTISEPISNAGTMTIEGGDGNNPSTAFSGSFTNAKGGTFVLEGGGNFNVWDAYVQFSNGLTNDGTILFTSNTTNVGYDNVALTISAGTLNNAGTINVTAGMGGTRSIDGSLSNSGTLNLTGGGLTIVPSGTNGTFTNTGKITVTTGQTFEVTSSETYVPSTGTISGSIVLNGVSVGSGTLSGGSVFWVDSTEAATASLTNDATLLVEGGDGNNPSSTFSGSFTNGKSGTLELVGGGTFNVWDSYVSFAHGLTNDGTLLFTSNTTNVGYDAANLYITGGSLTNAVGAHINVTAGLGGTRAIYGDFINDGALSVTGGGLTVSPDGTNATFTNAGSINVSSGQTLTITNSETFNPGTGTVAGNILIDNAFIGSGTLLGATVTLVNATEAVGANLVNAGLIVAEGGSGSNPNNTFDGTFTNAGGGTFEVEGGGSFGIWSSDVGFATGFTNSGTIEFSSDTTNVAYDGAAISVTKGTITNAATGQIDFFNGSGGARAINAPVVNQGLIEVSGIDVTQTGGLTDSGNIQVLGGTFTVNGKLSTSSSATTVFGIGGATADSGYGVLSVPSATGNSAGLAGTLGTVLLNGFLPTSGEKFNLLSYASHSGSFSGSLFADGNGITFTSSVGSSSVTVSAKTGQSSFGKLVVTAKPASGALTLTSTSGADVITVDQLGGVLYTVLNGSTELFSVTAVTTASVTASAGNDKVTLGSEVFTPFLVTAGSGNDTLTAGSGLDTLIAGSGKDVLNAGSGNDSLVGGSGTDSFYIGVGSETVVGGSGNDTFYFSNTTLDTTVTITESTGSGIDTLDTTNVSSNITANLGSNTLINYASRTVKTSVSGAYTHFTEFVAGSGTNTVTANKSGDVLKGTKGTDTFYAKNGVKDTLIGGSGHDKVGSDDSIDVLEGSL
jgi:hypothetical protein